MLPPHGLVLPPRISVTPPTISVTTQKPLFYKGCLEKGQEGRANTQEGRANTTHLFLGHVFKPVFGISVTRKNLVLPYIPQCLEAFLGRGD